MNTNGYSGSGAGDYTPASMASFNSSGGDFGRRHDDDNSHHTEMSASREAARALSRLPSSSSQRRMANQGLQDLYDWLGGESWRCNDGWLDPGSDVREWHGLTITSGGDLTSINLIANELEGEMPESLCNLYSLQYLNLSYNFGLRGWIPEGLGDLLHLRTLHLYSAMLTGAIPESLGQLDTLEELFLHGNSLSGEIPASLGNLRCLRKLFLNSNDLVGPIPPELGRLYNLDSLNVSWNNLHGEVPASVRALGNLQLLSIEGNEKLVMFRDDSCEGERESYETGGSSMAWEAAEEAMELHTATHLGAPGEMSAPLG